MSGRLPAKVRWHTVPRRLRREVIDGVFMDVAAIGDWPDTLDHARALNAAARFLEHCERSNVVAVAAFVSRSAADRTDPYDVVW